MDSIPSSRQHGAQGPTQSERQRGEGVQAWLLRVSTLQDGRGLQARDLIGAQQRFLIHWFKIPFPGEAETALKPSFVMWSLASVTPC